jgi:uncharacterized protein (DUF58 family)
MKTGRVYEFLEPEAQARVQNLLLIARGVVEGSITGLHASPFKGFSVEFAEHRKYAPGDNPRHLDWRMLGRTDRLYIKQYEEETNLRAQIVLDASGSMGFGAGGRMTKLAYGSHLAAILAYLLMRQQDAVGLITFDTRVRLEMPAGTTARHFDEMMRRLEQAKPGKETVLGETLHRLADRFKKRCLVILISDLYDEPESIRHALRHFRHKRHEVVLFQVLDPAERDLPYRELARFVDMETGERLQIDPLTIREAYRREMEAFLREHEQTCAECQVDHVLADTGTPYAELLTQYLLQRSRR